MRSISGIIDSVGVGDYYFKVYCQSKCEQLLVIRELCWEQMMKTGDEQHRYIDRFPFGFGFAPIYQGELYCEEDAAGGWEMEFED